MPDGLYNLEELDNKIDSFIESVESNIYPQPSDYYLCKHLSISPRTLSKYYTDGDPEDREKENNIYKGTAAILKKIVQYRETWYSQLAIDNPKLIGYAAFALKQARSGGWSDRQEIASTGEISLKIDLKGADGKPYGSG